MSETTYDDHPICLRCGEFLTYMWDAGYECSVCFDEAADRQAELDRQEAANAQPSALCLSRNQVTIETTISNTTLTAALPHLAPQPSEGDDEDER